MSVLRFVKDCNVEKVLNIGPIELLEVPTETYEYCVEVE